KADAGRQAVPDLRGHLADPAARDRPGRPAAARLGFAAVALEIDLGGRVALVTGGSRGLGRADALTLARAGADVVIADIQVESQATDEEIQGMGRRAVAVKCDVTDRDQVAATVARAVDELGAVDILVNN